MDNSLKSKCFMRFNKTFVLLLELYIYFEYKFIKQYVIRFIFAG